MILLKQKIKSHHLLAMKRLHDISFFRYVWIWIISILTGLRLELSTVRQRNVLPFNLTASQAYHTMIFYGPHRYRWRCLCRIRFMLFQSILFVRSMTRWLVGWLAHPHFTSFYMHMKLTFFYYLHFIITFQFCMCSSSSSPLPSHYYGYRVDHV